MFHAKVKTAQPELWISNRQLPKPAATGFYSKLDATLESFGFAQKVRELCAPAYDQSGTGRPGIDLVVYLKMMMRVSLRTCPANGPLPHGDSFSIREFLHYELTEATPEHSSATSYSGKEREQWTPELETLHRSSKWPKYPEMENRRPVSKPH